MATLHRSPSGTWRIRFRFDGRQYYRSLETDDPVAAQSVKTTVEETLALLKRGLLRLPSDATADDAGLFIISGGRMNGRPEVRVSDKTLKEVKDLYFDDLPEGAKASSSVYTEKIHVEHLVRELHGSTSLRKIPEFLDEYGNCVCVTQSSK